MFKVIRQAVLWLSYPRFLPAAAARRRLGIIQVLWLLLAMLLVIAVPSPSRAAELPWPKIELPPPQELVPGITWQPWTGKTVTGTPLAGQLLKVDPAAPRVEIRPVMAGTPGGEHLSSMAKNAAAVAGINGGYFTRSGGRAISIGNIIIDGQLAAQGSLLRPTLGLTGDGRLLVAYLDPRPVLEAEGQEIQVELVNLPYQPGHMHLYTSLWGPATGTPAGTPELVVAGGFSRFDPRGNSPIPPGGYVVSGPATPSLPINGPVNLRYELPPGWEEVNQALTGGPLLVEEGEPVFQAAMEGFTGSIYNRGPRTAVGSDAGGLILLVTVDGRQPGYSEGLTLEELALLMVQLGARTAVALDGGGSTEMWVQGRVVNRPADGSERLLPNGLLVLAQIPVYLNGQRLLFDVPPVIENSRTLVPFRKIFAALGAEVQWREETRQVLATGGGVTVELTVGQNTAYINGEPVSLEAAPKITSGRTMVPLRLVSEALGAGVQWDPEGPAVHIRTAGGDKIPGPSPPD